MPNPTSTAAPAASATRPHGGSTARSGSGLYSPITSSPRPAASSRPPTQSIRVAPGAADRPTAGGTLTQTTAAAASASGTFSQNIPRQPPSSAATAAPYRGP